MKMSPFSILSCRMFHAACLMWNGLPIFSQHMLEVCTVGGEQYKVPRAACKRREAEPETKTLKTWSSIKFNRSWEIKKLNDYLLWFTFDMTLVWSCSVTNRMAWTLVFFDMVFIHDPDSAPLVTLREVISTLCLLERSTTDEIGVAEKPTSQWELERNCLIVTMPRRSASIRCRNVKSLAANISLHYPPSRFYKPSTNFALFLQVVAGNEGRESVGRLAERKTNNIRIGSVW